MSLPRVYFFSAVIFALGLAIGVASAALAQVPVPALQSRVTDLSATLTPSQIGVLESSLADLEKTKGSQLAVLIVPSTQPESIEQYSIRVAEAWKLGRKGVDDGVLLLIAKEDRRLRIETGYGLEGALSDAVCKRIIDEIITPRFKSGDFAGGIEAGVSAIIKIINGEQLPEPSGPPGDDGSGVISFIVFLAIIVGQTAGRLIGRLPGVLVCAALVVAAGLFFALPPPAILMLVIITSVIALIISLAKPGGLAHSSSSGGSWSSGSSSSGGGFSGGGGSFGGGGSSGGW